MEGATGQEADHARRGYANTDRAGRYINQLAKHLSRRGEIDKSGRDEVVIRFEYGWCRLYRGSDGITLEAGGATPEGLESRPRGDRQPSRALR